MTNTSDTYVVFFSVIPDVSSTRRIVKLRELTENGLGSEIEIIDEAFFEIEQKYGAFLVVVTKDYDALETALNSCDGIFETTISKVEKKSFNPEIENTNFCFLQFRIFDEFKDSDPFKNTSVRIRSMLELDKESPYRGICTLQCNNGLEVETLMNEIYPVNKGFYQTLHNMNSYYNKLVNPEALSTIPKQQPSENITEMSRSGLLVNKGSKPIYFNDAPDYKKPYYDLVKNKKTANPAAKLDVSRNIYVWDALQSTYEVQLVVRKYNYNYPEYIPVKIYPTNCAPPLFSLPIPDQTTVEIDLNKDNPIHEVSDLYDWLNDLYNTSIYECPWPEDKYSGEKKAAYENILLRLEDLGFKSAPKEGKIPHGVIASINYRKDPKFSELAFDEVKSHLLLEDAYFLYAEKWLGSTGVFNSINETMHSAAQDSLTIAASLMQLPEEKSVIAVILDAIFGALTSIIGLVPGYGGGISAVVGITYDIVRKASEPGTTSKPIQATIAELAKVLIKFLDSYKLATATQLKRVKSNWGVLEEFVVEGSNNKLSEDKFGMNPDSKNPSPPVGFTTAAANTWRIEFYKAMFVDRYTANCTFYLGAPTANPFDPSKDVYGYIYQLNGVFVNQTGDESKGLLIFNCSTKAPKLVLDDLFSPDNLNVNPVDFYLGLNGWPRVIPGLNRAGNFNPIKNIYA